MILTFDGIVKGLLFTSLISGIPGDLMIVAEQKMFWFLCAALMGGVFAFGFVREIRIDSFFPLMLLGIFNVYMNNFSPLVLTALLNMAFICSGIWIMANGVTDWKGCRLWIGYGAMVNLLFYFLQYFKFNPFFKGCPADYYGAFFGNIPRLTTFLGIVAPILAEIWMPLIALVVVSCYLMRQMQILPLMTVGILIFSKCNRILKWVLGSGGLVFFVMYHAKILKSFSVRIPPWEGTLQTLSTRWISGIGIGNFPWDAGQVDMDRVVYSSFLQFILCIGILGVPLLVYWLRKYNWKQWSKSVASISLLFIMLFSAVEYPFEIKKLWFILMFIIANYIQEEAKQ